MTKTIKPIIRTCIITRKKQEQDQMFRIALTKEKEVILDLDKKALGRGYYLSKDKETIKKAKKKLPRMLKTQIDESVFEDMLSKV